MIRAVVLDVGETLIRDDRGWAAWAEWLGFAEHSPEALRLVGKARAQLWSGLPRDAFESLKAARRIAPQHTRDHPWVREDAATLRRLRRADADSRTSFAEWCHAGE